jgi:hypothetical protein
MNNQRLNKLSLFVSAILLSFSVSNYAAEANEVSVATINDIVIPVMDNAQIFANYTDELPAVLNYFTYANEAQIIDFYQQHYGNPLSQETKRDRLRLTYQQENQSIRVIISQQNKKRQVDVIIDSKEK